MSEPTPERSRRVRSVLLVGAIASLGLGAWWLGSASRPPPAGAPRSAPAPAPPPALSPAPRSPTGEPTSSARAEAVTKGLDWLARVQESDGSWDLARHNPWHGKTGLYGFTEEDHWFAPAATGLAALAFLESLPSGAERPAPLVRALDRLLAWQQRDGRIGFDEQEVDTWFRENLRVPGFAGPDGPGYKALTIHSFNHAVATAALALAAQAGGAAWREGARRALAQMVADTHPDYRWSAYLDPGADIGVVAYVALAAHSGAQAGLRAEAQPLLDALPDFLERVTDPATGRTRMLSDHPACFDGDDSTAINAYARRLLGQAPASEPLRAALASLCRGDAAWNAAKLPPPDGSRAFHVHLGQVVNHDAWTYGVRALEGGPGGRAKAWSAGVRALLVGNQVAGGEHSGSWDPVGVWDRVGGRLYATAMAVRALAAP